MLGLGLSIPGIAVRGGGDPLAPAPPTLDLVAASDTGSSSTDNITSDTTPDIDFITAIAVVAGDILKIFDNGVQIVSHTVTAGEAGSSLVALGLSALSDGTHVLTATHTIAGPHTSGASNALTLIIDTAGPTLSSPTGTKTGQTTADISVSTNEATGTLYYVVDQNLSTPTAAQIKAGQDQGGGAADKSGNVAVSSTGVKTFNITGLSVATTYKAYFAHEDAAGNISSASASGSFTTDAPAFTGPGDVVSGAANFYSVARAYTAAFAAGGTAIADLTDTATGLDNFTMNILSTGFADVAGAQAHYGATPISVRKLYDQTASAIHVTQATLSKMPSLTFNASNGLPCMTFLAANSQEFQPLITPVASPLTISSVFARTGNFTSFGGVGGSNVANPGLLFTTTTNVMGMFAGASFTFTAANTVFHALQAVFNGASSVGYIDGTSNTGTTTAFSGQNLARIGQTNGNFLEGKIFEFGYWASAFDATQQSNMNANQHGASGYNF